jgi:hypothetical protein
MMKIRHTLLLLIVTACLNACSDRSENSEPVAELAVVDNEQVQNRGANKDNWWDTLPRSAWSAFEKIEQSEDWFEVYRIDDDIFAIYVSRSCSIRASASATYVVSSSS